MRPLAHLVLVLLCGQCTACLLCDRANGDLCMEAFNQCESEPGNLLAQTLVELDLRKSVVRTRESAVGNLVADAFWQEARTRTPASICDDPNAPIKAPCPNAAVENGGGIRSQTPCGERQLVPAGPMYERDVNQMLPFGNKVVVVEVSGFDLKLMLEHAVDLMGQTGTAGQAGHFLQVSRLKFEVDCTGSSQALASNREQITAPGSRIVDGSLMIRTDADDSNPTWAPVSASREHKYYVAMTDFMGTGGDGFISLVARDGTDTVLKGDDGKFLDNIKQRVSNEGVELTDSAALALYLKGKKKVAPQPEGRIVIRQSCVAGLE